ncbi:MAG TPA: FtsX-like permease family protein [Marmoricola sp.]|nr:FtsX-like permease family protein [Marmoricola sp.]
MRDVALVFRALWFRRGTSAAVLVVASLVIGGAATGPLFLRSAAESVLHDTLRQAVLPAGRELSDQLSSPLGGVPLATVRRASARRLRSLPVLDRLLGPPVAGLTADTSAAPRHGSPIPVELAWRQAECQHVQIVRGHCPRRSDQVMMSADTSGIPGWRVGATLVVAHRPVTITGSYRPRAPLGDYWAGRPYFAPLAGSGSPGEATDREVDDLFTTRSALEALPPGTGATASLDRRVLIDRIRLADVPTVERQLRTYGGGVALSRHRTDLSQTSIPSVLEQARTVAGTLTAPVVVVEAQLLLLCWLVLFLVVANGAEARGPEIALAKLRGLPTSATVAFGLLDSLVLVLLALPLGLGAAYGWVGALADSQLAPGTPVEMTNSAIWAALGAAAGAGAAAVLAGVRTLRRPVVEQWRRATRRARARSWAVDVVGVLAAAAALLALVRTGSLGGGAPSTWALLAPGLVVLSVALVGSRVLPWCCRRMFSPSRRRGWLGTFLAVRQIARRPSTLRLALVLAVGVGLVTFAVDAWGVGRANAHDRAWTEVGAAETLEVLTPPGRDLGAIVDRLDPSGRQAAAVSETTDYSDVPPVWLLAVQSHRWAHVAFWRADFGPPMRHLVHRLDPPVARPVALVGDAFAVHVRVRALAARRAPLLVADVGQPGGGLAPVTLGRLHPGRQVLTARLPCGRCLLDGLHLDRPGGAFFPIRARLLVTAVTVHGPTGWSEVPADLTRSGQWRVASAGGLRPRPTPHGLELAAHATDVATPGWRVADRPARLPALVTGAAAAAGSRHRVSGLDGDDLPIVPVSTGPALPGVGANEVVVDRAFAQRAMHGQSGASEIVWLAPSAAATFPRRLRRAGVTILSRTSADEQTALYERQGPELALLLFLCGAALGAALAAGGCVLTSYLAGRRRTYEIAALLAQGLGSRTIVVALAAEQGLLLLFGIAGGVTAGIAGARLALPDIPEFADSPTAPPMLYGVHGALIAGTLAATVVVLALVVAASSVSLLRSSRFTQLREAPA